jgi:hypothetical protein
MTDQAGTGREPTYEVVSPLGRRVRDAPANLRPIEQLSTARIALAWDYLFRGGEMFDVIEVELRERYPQMQFIPYSVFGDIHGSSSMEMMAALPDRLRQHQVDAAIVGVGA